jgi:ribosomal protein S11
MAKGASKKVVKRKVKITPEGMVFIQATFNNIIISITIGGENPAPWKVRVE